MASTQNRDLDVTFGIEIEFSLAVLPNYFQHPNPSSQRQVYNIIRDPEAGPYTEDEEEDPSRADWESGNATEEDLYVIGSEEWILNAKHNIANLLTSKGFPTEASEDMHGPASQNDRWEADDHQGEVWRIDDDESITEGWHEKSGYFLLPLELNSPPLLHNEESKQQVRDVLKILSEGFIIMCDHTASTHVHIGNKGRGFDVKTAKNAMALYWAFEPQISTLHPPRYSTGPFPKNDKNPIKGRPYSPLLSEYSELAKYLRLRQEEKPLDVAIDTILGCNTMRELSWWFVREEDHHRLAVGMNYLLSTDPLDFKKTLEFRQHKSHLDGEEMTNWIDVCAGIVNTANTKSSAEVMRHCKHYGKMSKFAYSISQFLYFLQCKTPASYYLYRAYGPAQEPRDEKPDDPICYGPVFDEPKSRRRRTSRRTPPDFLSFASRTLRRRGTHRMG